MKVKAWWKMGGINVIIFFLLCPWEAGKQEKVSLLVVKLCQYPGVGRWSFGHALEILM